MSETFISKWAGHRWPQYCNRTLSSPVFPGTPNSAMASSEKPHFLQKKVLVIGIEDLKMLSIINLLKQFSQCIKMTWVEIFWEKVFGASKDFLVTAVVVCYWVICHLHSGWHLWCLKLLTFVQIGLYSTNFIWVSGQDASAELVWRRGPHACLHVKSLKTDVSAEKKERVAAQNPGALYALLQANIRK